MFTEKELSVLSVLRKDSRSSLTAISKQTCIPVSTVFDIVRKHEILLITRYTSLVNFQKLGYGMRVNFSLDVKKGREGGLLSFLDKASGVNSISRTDKGFYVDAVFRTMDDFTDFSEQLDSFSLAGKKEMHVIEAIKQEEFVACP